MKKIATILFSLTISLSIFGAVEGQTTVYSDDFTGEDNKGQIGLTSDLSGVDWSLDVSDGSFENTDDFYAVKNGVFEAQDVDGNVIWTSESFSISGYNNLEFSFDAGANGDFEASGDVYDVEIIIDDGTPETLFKGSVHEDITGDPMFFGSTQLTNSLQNFTTGIIGSGSSAIIRIVVNNNAGNEIYRFDNLSVIESSIKSEPSNHVTDFTAISSSISGIDLSWTDATGTTIPENYLILINESDTFSPPSDGTAQSDDTDLSDGIGALNVVYGVESATFSNLNSNTQYYFKIYPYTNLGSNIDFKTSGTIPSANTSTLEKPNLVLNEILSDPNGDANGDGTLDTSEDEFIEFVNIGDTNLNISGWVISDETSNRHTFPSNTVLKPYQSIVIFDGGTPTGEFGGSIVQTAGNLSLNNTGETISVKDASGNLLIEESYSGITHESETRSPDLTGTFDDHTTADNDDASTFSPGTRADGSTFQPRITFDSGEGWRIISSPTESNNYDDLLADLWTQGMSGADYTGGDPNVMTFDGSSFTAVGNLESDVMDNGQGFIVYVYSDDDYDQTSADVGFPKTLDLFGVPNSGDVNTTLNSGIDSWTLTGNPYNQPIDWDDVDKSDLYGTVYVYDHTYGTIDGGGDDVAESGPAGGGYRTYNGSSGSLSGGVIAPFQGFWVVSSVESPSLTFEEADQTIANSTFYTKEDDNVISIRLRGETKHMFNQAFLSFTEFGDKQEDRFDGLKLSPLDHRDYLSLSTEVEGTQMDINNLPIELYNPVEIPLQVQAFEAVESGWSPMGGEVKLSWPEMNNIPSDWDITLTDTDLNRTIDLRNSNEYVIEVEGSQNKIPGKKPFSPLQPKPFQKEKAISDARFLITINPNVPDGMIDNDIPADFALKQNYPNPFNPTTNIKFEIAETSNVTLNIYNVMGQRVATLINEVKAPGKYEIAWNAQEMASGIYYYRLRAGGVVFNRQMTLIK